MKTVWSKLPSRWIRDGALHDFDACGARGDAAALKLYVALAFYASFKSSPTRAAGSVRLTFTELGALCEISRHSIARGLRRLLSQARIDVHRVGTAQRYTLANYEDTGWAKLPRAHLLADRRFQSFGIRPSCIRPRSYYRLLVSHPY